MTAFQNEERNSRKSSVYNQTGQSYFQQLSAYNRMSAHLRRVLLAPCVIDSRNRRYTQDKGLDRVRTSGRSKSLDKIRTQEDIIDGIAYDTAYHPIDALRMSLGYEPEYDRKDKRGSEGRTRYSDWNAQSRAGGVSGIVTQKMSINSEADKDICTCLRSHTCKPCSTAAIKQRDSRKSSQFGGSFQRVNRSERKRSVSDRNQTMKSDFSRNNVDEDEPSYSFNSSFESSSETSSAPGSPICKKSECCRMNRTESPNVVTELGIIRHQTNKLPTVEQTEEAKYAKFIYDITQEIMINGFYTDQDLHATFKKHIDINSDTLDRNKMQSEIYQLKMSLNVPERSDDEENDDIERFVGSGRFAKFYPEKPPTPPKVLDENKLLEKLQNHETCMRYRETRRPRNSHGKNTVVLVDANPELLITERDVLLTLMEMKLDPRQIKRICKSLQNKSRETALSQAVQVDAETSCPRRKQDRANSPMNPRTVSRAIDSNRLYRNRMSQMSSGGARKSQHCQCCPIETYTHVHYSAEQSQTEVQPEIAIQATLDDSQGDNSRTASRSSHLDGISEVSIRTRSIGSSESRKIYQVPEIDEMESKEGKITKEPRCKRVSRQTSRALISLSTDKSKENRSEEYSEEEEQGGTMAKMNKRRSTSTVQPGNRVEADSSATGRERLTEEFGEESSSQDRMAKMNIVKRTSTMQTENRSEDDSSLVKSRESRNEEEEEEEEQERMSKINIRRNTSASQAGNRSEDDSLPILNSETKRESKKNESPEKMDKALTTSNENIKIDSMDSHDSSRSTENPEILNVSHSEFLNNFNRDDESVLPDISEKSEGVPEDIEIAGSQTTSRRSQAEHVIDNESANLPKQTFQVDVEPIAVESSMSSILKNIEASQEPSLPGTSGMVENLKDKPYAIQKDTEVSMNDEDFDEDKQVIVSTLKPFSSPELLPKVSSSRLNTNVDKKQRIVIEEANSSPESTPRISSSLENENYKSNDRTTSSSKSEANDGNESSKNSAKKEQSDETYSLKVERRRTTTNNEDKTDDSTSIDTQLDQPETWNTSLKMHSNVRLEDSKARVPSDVKNLNNQDEESQESYEFDERMDRSPTTIDGISKSKIRISRPDTDSIRSQRNFSKEQIENTKKQERKKSICSTCFSGLIGKGNRERNTTMETGALKTSGKTSRILDNDMKRRRATSVDDLPITTASDILFLREQNLNDSTRLSSVTPLDLTGRLDELGSSNSEEIEENVVKNSFFVNSYRSTYLEERLTSKSLRQRSDATFRRRNSNEKRKRTFLAKPSSSMYLRKEWTQDNLKKRSEMKSRRKDINKSRNSIARKLKATIEKLIGCSSNSDHPRDKTTKMSSSNVSSTTTAVSESSGDSSRLSEYTKERLPSTLIIKTLNSSCVCILTAKLVQSNVNVNCRADCRGRGFVCDKRCSMFHRKVLEK